MLLANNFMTNEEKLRSDWREVCERANNFTSYSSSLGSRYLEPENIADYWIEKIKQSNLALLEEVEREIKDYSTYWRHPMAVFPKPRTPQSELIEMKSKDEILSTLSKHKERLNKK